MAKRPLVALPIETSNSYARGLLRGIYAYLLAQRAVIVAVADVGGRRMIDARGGLWYDS
jgi:hypothetical protein